MAARHAKTYIRTSGIFRPRRLAGSNLVDRGKKLFAFFPGQTALPGSGHKAFETLGRDVLAAEVDRKLHIFRLGPVGTGGNLIVSVTF